MLPKYQRKGIGSALINSTLTQIKKQGFDGCVLVGFPDFYQKLGFISADPLVYSGVEKRYFMKLLFKNDIVLSGEIKFHPAFYS
ncbi:GNAT family N-acetyltransferase [Gilliamella sp. ESL0405]|uniref:GNAT family N-acetyltransferase n=1 Tax=Gilliamella sp. ESL0405 TaxID=2704653 RepID=UPI00351CCF37